MSQTPQTPQAPPPLSGTGPQSTGSSRHAGTSADQSQARTFPCEGCGADLTFDIGQQTLKCPYCGFEKSIDVEEDAEIVEQDFRAMLERMRELHDAGRESSPGEKEITCDSCGATVTFTGSLTSTHCPYCDAPTQLQNVHDAQNRIAVDGVLPFLITKQKAKANLRQWVKSRWFAPNEFKKRGVRGKFNGVYLPYWTFDALTATRYAGQRGEHYYVTVGTGDNKRRERRTRWYPASGDFRRFFDDVLVVAARGMKPDLVLALEPWPLHECKPFTQELLAGYSARTYETGLEDGFGDAKQRMDEALRDEIRRRIGGDEQRITWVQSKYGAITFKHLLLPVWLLAYRYHDKVYQLMVNASTGEVQGERPYSWVKITLAVLAVLLLIGLIWVFGSGSWEYSVNFNGRPL